MNKWVWVLAISGSQLDAGGYFTTAGGKTSAHVAKAELVLPANVISSSFDVGDFVARFDGTPGITYTIEQTPAMSPANWQKLTNLTAPTNCIFELRDAVQPAGQRYYRAVYPAY